MSVPTRITIATLEPAKDFAFRLVSAAVTGTADVYTDLQEVKAVIPAYAADLADGVEYSPTAEIPNQTTYPGKLTLKAWKATGDSDATPAAATTAKTVVALVIGVPSADQ